MSQDSAVPAHGQQVITACIALYRFINGIPHVMLAKRSDVKKFLPGKYELPGGHIDFGEQLDVGLKRELYEELSIDVELESPFAAFTYMNDVKGSHSVEIIYLGTLNGDEETIQLQPDEHSEIIWISKNNIDILEKANGADDAEFPVVVRALDLLDAR